MELSSLGNSVAEDMDIRLHKARKEKCIDNAELLLIFQWYQWYYSFESL